MSVSDKQAATLIAQLSGRIDEYKRLYAELDPEEVGHSYSALVGAATAIAIDRRFVEDDKIASDKEVIDFVAELRSRSLETTEALDPIAAEQLILQNLGKGDISNFDARVLFTTQIIVLAGLVVDEQYNDADLTSFIQAARQVADHWIANDQ